MPDRPPFELVVPRDTWEHALRQLLTEPGAVAVGRLRRNSHGGADELLADDLEVLAEPPAGATHPPLSDWVLLAAGDTHGTARRLLQRVAPQPTQLWCIALVGQVADRGLWDGAVWREGAIEPLAALRVVGPGMLRAARGPASWQELSNAELERWSRTRGALSEEVWRKVSGSRALILGTGRTGSALAFFLAALGVRHLSLADNDVLGGENLDAMYCVTPDDVGQLKVAALQERLLEFRPDLSVTSLALAAHHTVVVHEARGVDLIASCGDNDTPRLAGALLANRFLKLHLDVATEITRDEGAEPLLAGDIRLMIPRQACVACVGGLSEEAEARYELFAPEGALRRGQQVVWNQQRAGSLITLNSMTVSIGTQLWLDLLAGKLRQSHWHRVRWVPGEGLQTDFAPVAGSEDCSICHAPGGSP